MDAQTVKLKEKLQQEQEKGQKEDKKTAPEAGKLGKRLCCCGGGSWVQGTPTVLLSPAVQYPGYVPAWNVYLLPSE